MSTTLRFPVIEKDTSGFFLKGARLRLGKRYCILRAEEVRWTRQYSQRQLESRLLTALDGSGRGAGGSRFFPRPSPAESFNLKQYVSILTNSKPTMLFNGLEITYKTTPPNPAEWPPTWWWRWCRQRCCRDSAGTQRSRRPSAWGSSLAWTCWWRRCCRSPGRWSAPLAVGVGGGTGLVG